MLPGATDAELTRFALDEAFMRNAISVAADAIRHNEVPVGAVVTRGKAIVSVAANRTVRDQDATAHAELLAIREACQSLERWRLDDCTIYVTLEPCAMCAGAMVLSRIKRVVFGAFDPKAGMGGSIVDLLRHPRLNHNPEVRGGIQEDECALLLTDFFESRRLQAP